MQIDAHVREAILAHPSQPGRRRSTRWPGPRRCRGVRANQLG
jgi:hypothetical protein